MPLSNKRIEKSFTNVENVDCNFLGSSLLVPTLSLTSHILLFNLGYGCLGYPAMAEMLPSNLKVKGLTFIQVNNNVVSDIGVLFVAFCLKIK